MSGVVSIGQVPWSRADLLAQLAEFSALYQERPIADNAGGMLSSHMFHAWFVMRALQPSVIVESGVFLGQGTWFLERACPNAQFYCIDLNLDRIQYRSNHAKYYDRDFERIDWTSLPKEETVLFFDDHQDAYRRTITAKWFGFKHLIFEDNYPPARGDCYSLKQAFAHAGFTFQPPAYWSLRSKLKWRAAHRFGTLTDKYIGVAPNTEDAGYLRQNLEIYYEFPPIFRAERTYWGDLWDDSNYSTPPALLQSVDEEYQQVFMDDAMYYGWMCYAKLR